MIINYSKIMKLSNKLRSVKITFEYATLSTEDKMSPFATLLRQELPLKTSSTYQNAEDWWFRIRQPESAPIYMQT